MLALFVAAAFAGTPVPSPAAPFPSATATVTAPAASPSAAAPIPGPSPSPDAAVSPGASASPALPPCILAKVAPSLPIDSKTGLPGQPFKFTVSSITDPGNAFPTILTGAEGWGEIAVVRHGRTGGDAGLLVLESRYIVASDGKHVPVTLVRSLNGLFMGKTHNSPGMLGWIPYVGYVTGAYDALHKGGDVVVSPADLMTVSVGDQSVMGACALPTAPP